MEPWAAGPQTLLPAKQAEWSDVFSVKEQMVSISGQAEYV